MSPIAPIAHEKKMTGSCSACMRSHRDHEMNEPAIFGDIVVVSDPAGAAAAAGRGRSDELWGRSPGSRCAQHRAWGRGTLARSGYKQSTSTKVGPK